MASLKKNTIKRIVFDLGGVLFEYATPKAVSVLNKEYGYNKSIVERLLHSKKSKELREGKIKNKEFWSYARKVIPKEYDVRMIKSVWDGCSEINKEVFDIVKKLSKNKRIKLMVFSGNVRTRIRTLDKKYGFRKYFYKEVYSFNHKINKPKTNFVRIMVEKSGVKPEEILYIDDNQRYAKPAMKIGVNVILFNNAKQLSRELKRYGLF